MSKYKAPELAGPMIVTEIKRDNGCLVIKSHENYEISDKEKGYLIESEILPESFFVPVGGPKSEAPLVKAEAPQVAKEKAPEAPVVAPGPPQVSKG